MGVTKEEYSALLKDIEYRKGEYFIKAVENFYTSLPGTGSGKVASELDKYQLYRLEANIRWNFYRYLENIERVFIAALATKNSFLKTYKITNEDKFELNFKMALVSGQTKDSRIKNKDFYLMKKAKQKIVGGKKHASDYMSYIESSKIFNDEFALDTNDQYTIREIRNMIQHFDFILDKNLNTKISNFIKLFSDNFKQSFSVYILIEIIKVITRYDLKMKIIEFIKENWGLFHDDISEKINQEIKSDYKQSKFFQENPCRDEYNESRKEKSKIEISEENWEDYCKFQLGLEVASKYSDEIRIIIQRNTIETQKNR